MFIIISIKIVHEVHTKGSKYDTIHSNCHV